MATTSSPLLADTEKQVGAAAATTMPRRLGFFGGFLMAAALLLAGSRGILRLFSPEALHTTIAFESALGAAHAPGAEPSPSNTPPLFRISAESLYSAGLQQGRLARERIHGWLATAEMRGLLSFVAAPPGAEAFARLKHDNEAEFPELVEEMRGLAEGAGIALDHIWCANLLNELGNLMVIHATKATMAKDCSDVYAVSSGGYATGFAHGHNTDWSDAVKPFMYFISLTYNGSQASGALPGAGFASCAGLAYPGHLIGSPPTWNPHGMYATQNSLAPRRSRAGGLAGAFVQRRATCGAHSLDEAVAGLGVPGWSDGASVNIVDLHGRRMANVEVWEDIHSTLEVTAGMGNYSHFNQYKHLRTAQGWPIDDPRSFRRDLRQARIDSLQPVRSDRDVEMGLSDEYIFSRRSTVISLVLNGTAGTLKVWCCGVPPASQGPVYTWNITSFFTPQF